jgi:hypothetical protein
MGHSHSGGAHTHDGGGFDPLSILIIIGAVAVAGPVAGSRGGAASHPADRRGGGDPQPRRRGPGRRHRVPCPPLAGWRDHPGVPVCPHRRAGRPGAQRSRGPRSSARRRSISTCMACPPRTSPPSSTGGMTRDVRSPGSPRLTTGGGSGAAGSQASSGPPHRLNLACPHVWDLAPLRIRDEVLANSAAGGRGERIAAPGGN